MMDLSQMHEIVKREAITTTTAVPNTTFADYDVSVVVSVSDNPESELQIIMNSIRQILTSQTYPYRESPTLELSSVNITTVCAAESNQMRCQCEDHYSWPCEKCYNYSLCPNTTINSTCDTVYGLPTDDEYCQPFTTACQSCPASTTNATTTAVPNTTTTAVPNTTTTAVNNTTFADYDVSVIVSVSDIPESELQIIMNSIRQILTSQNNSYPDSTLELSSVNITTVCAAESNQMRCQCEDHYSWPCEKCYNYSLCPNTTINSTCDTVYGLPTDDEYCQPFTTACQSCPTASKLTTTQPLTTTPPPTTTTQPPTTASKLTTTQPLTTTPPPTTTTQHTTTTASTTNATTTAVPNTTTTTVPNTTTTASTTTTPPPTTTTTSTTTTPPPTTTTTSTTTTPPPTTTTTSTTTTPPPTTTTTSTTTTPPPTTKTTSTTTTPPPTTTTTSTTTTTPSPPKGEALEFQKKPVLFSNKAELVCGPPGRDFPSSWTATWFRNNFDITAQHTVNKVNGMSVLTIETFYRTNTGVYECRLTNGKNVFRQQSKKELTFIEEPNIKLSQNSQKKTCLVGISENIECSVQNNYKVRWKTHSTSASSKTSITVNVTKCPNEFSDTCEVIDYPQYNKKITLKFELTESACTSEEFGRGNENEQVIGQCEEDKTGEKVFICLDKNWEEVEDNCVLTKIQQLLDQTQDLKDPAQVPLILEELNDVTNELQNDVTESSATIRAIVTVMEDLANISQIITDKSMKDILNTSSILTTDETKTSWETLNGKHLTYEPFTRSTVNRNASSSRFLYNLETYARKYENQVGNLAADLILFNKTVFSDTFDEEYDGSVQIQIPESGLQNNEITVLTFKSLHNVLPPEDKNNSTNVSINAQVVLVQSKGVDNVTFTFELQNNSLYSPQCVFWNFSLFDNSGGWDDEGCTLVNSSSSSVVCQCNHLTSFSVLMSTFNNFPDAKKKALAYITYVGVSISIGSLVICLIIEAAVWKKIRKPRVSYMRHVTIVNIAVSLLCADIWFLIGAAISKEKLQPSCTAATFFIHFFYLALFFWMLASGLLLLYRTISVFDSGVRKGTMLAIGFSIGYGAPIIIAVVTIAATAGPKHYTQLNNVCWLNWNESRALLAFVIPALTIVAINFLILSVVIYKVIRRRASTNGANADEKHVLVVIIRCLAFLTPFFGLTWCLGVGTMIDIEDEDTRYGLHFSFAFFNSIQGFFVLLFGTLLDNKVRREITPKSTSSVATRSTSGGQTSSSSGWNFLRRRMKMRRDYRTLSRYFFPTL
ncbi:uncharacterized protein [Eucyclogobius newberryi]|uniref:uncharacterized protein n=1 Tax=Eucyclogobius newberryi TaxID=166745 RepID=UPI003B5C57A9